MKGRRVLLVEPDNVLAKLYSEYLELQGYSVDRVKNAQTALTVADQHKPDVVILETQLPHHSGFAFLYEFRSYADWQDIPVVVHSYISPIKLEAFRQTLDNLGVVARLYKPQTSLKQLEVTLARFAPAFA